MCHLSVEFCENQSVRNPADKQTNADENITSLVEGNDRWNMHVMRYTALRVFELQLKQYCLYRRFAQACQGN